MDDCQEQGNYEERLKEVFDSFDASGAGSLSPEELCELCQSLHLDDATPVLQALLQNQDQLDARVEFEQFKDALILVLSSNVEPQPSEEETLSKPDSPEIQPKFVKGSKRYGRRSTPEFIEPISDHSEVRNTNLEEEEVAEDNYDSAVPRKRERWNSNESSTEEYEAEGQLRLWNPDEPSTPRGSNAAPSTSLEERLREACSQLMISWDGFVDHDELLVLSEHLGLKLNSDLLQSLSGNGVMSVEEFVSRVLNSNKTQIPPASTPYRQLKRHHSTQPFDEGGRRIAPPSALTSTIGMRLFSTLDDGTGFTPVEYILDAWLDEGIANSAEILQALNFDLDGKLSLSDLTTALENELLITKNGIHQAAVASFKAEIRYLLEQVDREMKEKEKILSDLEKAEKLKNQLATEVDEHHSAIEHKNNLNLRKLEQDHKEKLSAVRSELMKEMDQLKQQAGLQREELEAEIQKIREDESFLRDHLSISVKDNRRLEIELLDSTEKLMEAESQVAKLQRSLDNIMKERFGDLDPSSADFFLQEERMKQLGAGYEAQYREMQDRIDELQAELRDFHSLGRVQQPIGQPLSEELESKSPGMESDPGIGSEEVQPFSLEAEMMLEQLKEQHLREMEDLRNQLQSKINDFDMMVEKHGLIHEDQKAALSLQYQQELQAMKVELASTQSHIEKLQSQLEQAELENASLQRAQAEDREVLENKREEEVRSLRQQLTEAHSYAEDLKEQLTTLSTQLVERGENHANQIEDLRKRHADEIKKLEQEHVELSEARLDEERAKMQEEKAEMEKLLDDFRREREVMQESHEDQLKARSEEAKLRFEHERDEIVERLTEQWQKERARLDEEHSESLQVLLEEEMLKLIKEHEDKENKLREQWEHNVAELQEHQEETFLQRLLQERLQLQEQFEQREKRQKEQWEMERLQLEEDYEGMLQEKLSEEREKFQSEAEEQEKRQEFLMAQVMTRHREAIKELTSKHGEERDALSSMLEKLRDDIAKERKELELSFSQRIREVEARFSGDQDSVEKRFQADVLRLEQHYQTELETLSQSHTEQKLLLDAEIQEALQKAEEQGRTMEREREQLDQQWREEMHQQESQHEKKMEELAMKNQQLQTELDELSSMAQTAELELSRQLNELHNRLQENLETRDEFLAQSERKAEEAERLLQQTLEEKEELLRSHTELEARNTEMLSVSEKQTQERIELVSECDGLKMKIEELEVLLQQAAVDFYHETKELQEHLSTLEKGLRRDPENARKGLLVHQGLAEKALEEEEAAVDMCFEGPQNVSPPIPNSSYPLEQNVQIMAPASCAGEDDDLASKHHGNLEVKRDGWIYETDVLAGSKQEVDGESSPECCSAQSTSCKGLDLDSSGPDENNFSVDSNSEAFFPRPLCETVVALRASEASDAGTGKTEKTLDLESCEAKNKPQDVPVLPGVNVSQDEERNQAIEDEPFMPEEVSDPDVPSPPDVQVSHDKQEVEPAAHLTFEQPSANINEERSHGDLETADEGADCPLLRLQVMCDVATEENILLLKKISLLQQKTQILEKLLYHNSEKIKTGNQVLEENYSLKVKILLLMERVKELELKASEAAALQGRYEDCLCENARLKYRNGELEKSVQRFERGVSRWEGFPNHSKVSLLDEIGTLREDNRKFSELLGELELQREILSAIPAVETIVDRPGPTDVEGQGATELQGCCAELEKENIGLREAIWALQDESQTLHESTQAQRSEAGRLAEENHLLRQKITELKEEDLKEAQQELLHKLEHLNKMKVVAQGEAEAFSKQVSRMHLQSQQLEDKNRMLSEKEARNAAEMETLRRQLAELVERPQREASPEEDRRELAACVSALETELRKALEDTERMENRNTQLSQQLSVLREKAYKADAMEIQLSQLVVERDRVSEESQGLQNQLHKAKDRVVKIEESLEDVTHQNGCLRSELLDVQRERDFLKHDITVLRKQLQNVNEKNRVLEKALYSGGLLSQGKKRHRDEVFRLVEQDQQLLRQENERLQMEVRRAREDLLQSRETVRQLDATVLSLSQSPPAKALEQENAALKRELAAQKELSSSCAGGQGHVRLESLQQENEALKAQMSRLSTHLIDTLQAQLVGLLPPSPLRMPRVQNPGDDAENAQEERMRRMKGTEERMRRMEGTEERMRRMEGTEERMRRMKGMEERMKEVELSLRNLKLLLREKDAQLKEQRQQQGKAEVLIGDLYVENAQLLKALEITEQRQKITEKKNYLLEEKISSLNKMVCDLKPSPLSPLRYQYKCSEASIDGTAPPSPKCHCLLTEKSVLNI